MKTYEPLPLLECIKEYNSNSQPSISIQKSIDMTTSDEDNTIEYDEPPNLLNNFKTNNTSPCMDGIQIKTIEIEYNRSNEESNNESLNRSPNESLNNRAANETNNKNYESLNHNIINKSAIVINNNEQCANTEKTNNSSNNFIENKKDNSSNSKNSIFNNNIVKINEPSSVIIEGAIKQINEAILNNSNKNDNISADSLSKLELLNPYIRTNEFIEEILKSPIHQQRINDRILNIYEEDLNENEQFKEINLNSPMKPPIQTIQNQMNDHIDEAYNSHLVHLKTLEEIDEDEALCLCSNSVSSTLSSTTKRLPCISDSADIDSGTESASSSWDRTVAEAKGHAITRLQDELRKAHEELKLKDEEVSRLSRIREEVESELEDLTASLFQEAHNMVREANMRQATSEKLLRESKLQVDVLSAEVNALKALVLTSTPSRPNPHLHPQIENKNKDDSGNNSSSATVFFKKHRRSPSHCNLKYGREDSPPEAMEDGDSNWNTNNDAIMTKDCKEVDPVVHKEFLEWRKNPIVTKDDAFIARIYEEDIDKNLDFSNIELALEVKQAVDTGDIFIEAVNDKTKCSFPKKCALLEVPRLCHYRMKLGDSDHHYYISKLCRNRIIKVCDLLNYLMYIQRGLVKSSVHDVYWEINRLRKEIILARLGLTKDDD